MLDMFQRKIISPILIASLFIAAICGGCTSSAPPAASNTSSQPANAPTSQQTSGIDVEIVTPQALEGSINATGKILVTEDRTASIGPVHEGRIVNLYAGQGSVVHKGQKLADLESADIDEAEAGYLKALADLENANRTSAAEIKFNQATYDRTKLLVEKEITPAKNLQQAEHDLEVAKATGTNSIASAKVAVGKGPRPLPIPRLNGWASHA